jgi:plasmid stabilization system protein ParE
MAYKVIIEPNAKNSLVESIDWYEKAKTGLGIRFYRQLKRTVEIIKKNPKSFPVRYKTVRTAIVKDFPFLIHYFIDIQHKLVVVTAVLHTSRDSEQSTNK